MKITSFLLAFYMFLGGLIPRSDFSQMVHFGDLFDHYLEHKTEEANTGQNVISFLEFLYIHFIDTENHSDSDHEEKHQQLPLQTLNGLNIFISTTLDFPDFSTWASTFCTNIAYKSPFYLNGFLRTTFLPPSK